MPEIHSASNTRLKISGTVTLHRRTGEYRTSIIFGLVDKPVVLVFLRAKFIDNLVKYIYSMKEIMISYHSSQVLILMKDDTSSEAKEKSVREKLETS